MMSGETRGFDDRRIEDSLEICYYFRCPAGEGLAAGQTVPNFPLGAVRLDGIIGEGKRGLELRGEELRYGLVSRENTIVPKLLD